MASRIFLPWENERGVRGVSVPRIVRVLALILAVVAVVALFRREEEKAGIRATRASITTLWSATRSYRADHAGACPRELSELVAGGYVRRVPFDAWGNAFRLECTESEIRVLSDGPDGLPYGLDRVE